MQACTADLANGEQGRDVGRTVFVDDDAQAAAFDAEEHFDTPAELLGRAFNRPRKAQLEGEALVSGGGGGGKAAKKAEKQRTAAYRELLQRRSRQEALDGASKRLEYEKQVMGKGRKRKLSAAEAGGRADVYKWKTERKR